MSDINKKDDPERHITDLLEILKESGAKVTIDMYRDNTKGCGPHCRGWNKNADSWCPNHTNAIMTGNYVVPGGNVEWLIAELRKKIPPST